MPFGIVFNKLPNLGSKKDFIELNKDGNEEAVVAEKVVAPTASPDIQPSTSSPNEEEEMEEEEIGDKEEVEEDEDLQELRITLNKNMDKNATMMINKNDHKRNKTTIKITFLYQFLIYVVVGRI